MFGFNFLEVEDGKLLWFWDKFMLSNVDFYVCKFCRIMFLLNIFVLIKFLFLVKGFIWRLKVEK